MSSMRREEQELFPMASPLLGTQELDSAQADIIPRRGRIDSPVWSVPIRRARSEADTACLRRQPIERRRQEVEQDGSQNDTRSGLFRPDMTRCMG
jgi:hypothetical protein